MQSTPPPVQPPRTREHLIGDGIAWTARWSIRWVFIALGAVLLGEDASPLALAMCVPVAIGVALATMRARPASLPRSLD